MATKRQTVSLRPYEMVLLRSLVIRKVHDMLRGAERLIERAGPDSPQVKRFYRRLDRYLDIAEELKHKRDQMEVPLDRYRSLRHRFPGSPRQ